MSGERGQCHVVIYLSDVTDDELDKIVDGACDTLADLGLGAGENEDDPVRSLVGVKAEPFPDLSDVQPFLDAHSRFAIPTAPAEQCARPSRFAEALAEFHGHPNSILDDQTNGIPLRRTLLEEEHKELIEAIDEGDLHHIAREMGDVLYVVWGTALVYGIDLDAAFEEIHRAAMDKMRAGLRRPDGKIAKPPGFVPPDMTAAVNARSRVKREATR